mmetsp:Transcript_557/g.1226  ORF Transcript_557/g.1226 Transcript_557/m.1226 type:complete len:89 (-) Transcript_557:140-406(-)
MEAGPRGLLVACPGGSRQGGSQVVELHPDPLLASASHPGASQVDLQDKHPEQVLLEIPGQEVAWLRQGADHMVVLAETVEVASTFLLS